eukprot:1150374-Pelagomonas_calceolata.AAC.5
MLISYDDHPQFQEFLLLDFTPIVHHGWLTSCLWLPTGIRKDDPLDLSQLVMDLRSRHLAYWRQLSSHHPQDLNSKKVTIITGVPSQPRMHMSHIGQILYNLPNTYTWTCLNVLYPAWPKIVFVSKHSIRHMAYSQN